jgi:hypothetical protein
MSTTASEVIQSIQEFATASDGKLKFIPDDFPVGQYIPQGDINILRLEKLPERVVLMLPDQQLAPGSTRGSRHCIRAEDMDHCEFYHFLDATPLEGPVIVFKERTIIEHPEHDDQSWPAGIVMIGYARSHAEEVRRVQD